MDQNTYNILKLIRSKNIGQISFKFLLNKYGKEERTLDNINI